MFITKILHYKHTFEAGIDQITPKSEHSGLIYSEDLILDKLLLTMSDLIDRSANYVYVLEEYPAAILLIVLFQPTHSTATHAKKSPSHHGSRLHMHQLGSSTHPIHACFLLLHV